MRLALVTSPDADPVTLDEAKDHLRVLSDDEDAYIKGIIAAAVKKLDGEKGVLGRALITQEWDLYLDEFPCGEDPKITVPLPPLQSVEHIKYVDTDGQLQTLSSSLYAVDAISHPGVILPAYGESWPSTRRQRNAVVIRFKCGYGDDAEDVPETLVHAIKLLISHFYENREPVNVGNIVTPMPMSVEFLISPYKIQGFGA